MPADALPHFEGYWVLHPLHWKDDEEGEQTRVALFFFDDTVMVRAIREKHPDGEENRFRVQLTISGYFVDEDFIHATDLQNTESIDDEDWEQIPWRVSEEFERPLELDMYGSSIPFVPANKKIIVAAGFPEEFVDDVEKNARKHGWKIWSESRTPSFD